MSGTNGHEGKGGCCGGSSCDSSVRLGESGAETAERVRATVREGYGKIAETGVWSGVQPVPGAGGCCGGGGGGGGGGRGGGCCGPTTLSAEDVAVAVGYGRDELGALPESANLGLSCGNPTALAALRPGEVVVDLGAGAGFDCFIAGPKVGATGRVIGVDMTPEMLSRARSGLAAYRARSGLDNVEFRLGEIENLPVADASVDVVISNCVLNLSPDKERVWREIARVLKPGGRVAVSDLALLKPLPEAVKADVEALVGCIAGAALVDELREQMRAAGLVEIELTPKPGYIEAMTDANDPLYRRILAALPAGAKASDYVTSLDISARRAAMERCCMR
ncbi:MAG: arsenite methyltransferase [Phycisphaerales bacterium]